MLKERVVVFRLPLAAYCLLRCFPFVTMSYAQLAQDMKKLTTLHLVSLARDIFPIGFRMKMIMLAFALSLPLANLTAQAIDWTEVHNKTIRGIDLLYNFELDAAARTFDSVSQQAPGDPRGHFFGSMVIFWRSTLTGNKQEYERFIDVSDRVIEVCEDLLDRNPRDAKARFYLGGIMGYRGMAHQSNGSIIKAVKEGKVGYEYLEDAVRLDSTLYDAKMGFGLFKYLIAKIPKSLRWIINLVGFSGDLEGGLKLLQEAADHGLYTKGEASLYLAQFLFNEHRYDEAFAYLTPLLKDYPDNALFQVLAANWNLRMNKPDEALVAARKAADINKRKTVRYAEEVVYSTLGGIYYSKNDFSNASDNYALYLQKMSNPERTSNWIYYRAGVSCEMAGDRAKATDAYRRMRKVNDKDRASDTYYYRRGQGLLQKPMSDAEKILTRAANDQARKEYDSARRLLLEALPMTQDDPDLRLRVLYALQQLAFDQNQYDEVLTLASQIFAVTPQNDLWIIPHALLRQGQALAKMGKTDAAARAFDRAVEYDDYDFQSSLEARIEDEKMNLRQQ
jgi:tetratricopeptide (TPR) repeat protein